MLSTFAKDSLNPLGGKLEWDKALNRGLTNPVKDRLWRVPDKLTLFVFSLRQPMNGYSAFLSYASNDIEKALEVCGLLEKTGLKIWMAPRDVRPGESYPKEIVRGIETANALILLLSEHSNQSSFVGAEVERAYSKKKPIFPFRIANTAPSPHLELLVSTQHWIEGWGEHFSKGIENLAAAVAGANSADGKDSGQAARLAMRRILFRRWTPLRVATLSIGAATILLAAVLSGLWLVATSKQPTDSTVGKARTFLISRILTISDSSVFQGAQTGNYEVVRFLSGGKDLASNTQIAEDMKSSEKTYDLLANQGFFLKDQVKTIQEMLEKGVRIRIILIDHTPPNRQNNESFYAAADNVSNSASIAKTIEVVFGYERNVISYLEPLVRKHGKLLELRVLRRQLLYTMWIRDAADPEKRACHLGVQFYGGNEFNPYFRCSTVTGKALGENLSKQFEMLWETSIAPEGYER